MKPRPLKVDIAGEGDPVVLIPGGLTGWISWIPHQVRLSDRHRVIRVQPIHNELGSAGRPGDPTYTRGVARESFELTLDELGIDEFDLAGWSAGGKTALDFALSEPERLRTLTLVEPAADWVLRAAGEIDVETERRNQFVYSLSGKTITEDDLADFFASAGFVQDPSQARLDRYWERALPHRMTLSWLSEGLMGSDHTVADLASIRAPVLLTKGTTTGRSDRRVVDVLADALPNARVEELGGGHAHHIESIDRFLDEFETHLRAARPARP